LWQAAVCHGGSSKRHKVLRRPASCDPPCDIDKIRQRPRNQELHQDYFLLSLVVVFIVTSFDARLLIDQTLKPGELVQSELTISPLDLRWIVLDKLSLRRQVSG
jgi:hypothetical protein